MTPKSRGWFGALDAMVRHTTTLAHSQGNIVCGAALTDYDLTVDNYVLTQAAVPAGGCDVSGGQNDPEQY